jgi:hypothetical protein
LEQDELSISSNNPPPPSPTTVVDVFGGGGGNSGGGTGGNDGGGTDGTVGGRDVDDDTKFVLLVVGSGLSANRSSSPLIPLPVLIPNKLLLVPFNNDDGSCIGSVETVSSVVNGGGSLSSSSSISTNNLSFVLLLAVVVIVVGSLDCSVDVVNGGVMTGVDVVADTTSAPNGLSVPSPPPPIRDAIKSSLDVMVIHTLERKKQGILYWALNC